MCYLLPHVRKVKGRSGMTDRYEMQMADRELSLEEAQEILEAGEFAVISTVDPDGTPYGVPVSYVIIDDKMYIHTAKGPGHKFDDWNYDPRVSVAVATEIEPCYEETFFTTRFASVVAQGTIQHVEDPAMVRRVLVDLCMKYLPQFKDEIGGAIQREIDVTDAWCITFDEVRGKAGRRLSH